MLPVRLVNPSMAASIFGELDSLRSGLNCQTNPVDLVDLKRMVVGFE